MRETIQAVHRSDRHKTTELRTYRALTLDEVKAWPESFHNPVLFCQDQHGKMANVRRNGRVKTWKRDPARVEIPVKFGVYEAFRVTDPGELYVLVE
jgi:hypothetical protein